MKVFFILLFGALAFGAENHESAYGLVDGYTDDVSHEAPETNQEVNFIPRPQAFSGPNAHQYIFNNELSKEFVTRYQDQFGLTEAEENYFMTNRQGYSLTPWGLSRSQEDQKRQEFAQYMAKRLAEFHTEHFLKNDPGLRKVYELKQKVSNYSVELAPQTRVDMTYSFVGNYLSVNLKSPKFNSSLLVNMNPSSYLPGTPEEVKITATKDINRHLKYDVSYEFYKQNLRNSVSQQITPDVQFFVAQTTAFKGYEVDTEKESLSMLGLGAKF